MLEAYKLAFMAEVIPAAKKACAQYGIPYQICCAQAALESGWGKRAAYHNYFGIKGSGDAGTQNWATKEYTGTAKQGGGYGATKASFAKFSSAEAAFKAYAGLVANGTMFEGSLNYAGDPAAFTAYIWAGGYASAPTYTETVIGVCRTFFQRLKELNKVPDKVLATYGVTREQANEAIACAPDFDLRISKTLREALSILRNKPMGKQRREARAKIFTGSEITKVEIKQKSTVPTLSAAAILLALL